MTLEKPEIRSLEDQDAYAIESVHRACGASAAGDFDLEISPVSVKNRRGNFVIFDDADHKNVGPRKISALRPVFNKYGTVNAANASTINDGAVALVLMKNPMLTSVGQKCLQ